MSDRKMEKPEMLYRKLVNTCRGMNFKISFNNDNGTAITALNIPKEFNQLYEINKPLIEKGIIDRLYVTLDSKLIARKLCISLQKKENNTFYCVVDIYSTSNRFIINQFLNSSYCRKTKSIIFYEEGVYTQYRNNQKCYPTSLSDLSPLEDSLKEVIMSVYSNNSSCYKDFLTDNFYPPIKLVNLSEYHNKKEYLEQLFGISLPKSSNKIPFNILYCICCASSYISNEQFSYLYQNRFETDIQFKPSIRNKKSIAKEYLNLFFCNKLSDCQKEIVKDYIDMSIELKQPIDISAGKRKLYRLHDVCMNKFAEKANRGKKLAIPQTPLKYLKLPSDFVLIKTKSMLNFEGKRNHNCVASYLDLINKGQCIIYTADINDEHLTIEVCYRKRGRKNPTYEFFVPQCYKSYNRCPDEATVNYVNEVVQNAAQDAINNYNRAIKRGDS